MPATSSIRLHLRQETEEATASGIYGLIVGAAVLVASHAEAAPRVVIAVLVTLVVYWAAERYARIVAERIHAGHRPTWNAVRRQMTSGWEMVTTSGLPMVVLIAVRAGGTSLKTAEIASLASTTVLLCVAGWQIGGNDRLTLPERVMSMLVAGMFGVVLIVCKTLLH